MKIDQASAVAQFMMGDHTHLIIFTIRIDD